VIVTVRPPAFVDLGLDLELPQNNSIYPDNSTKMNISVVNNGNLPCNLTTELLQWEQGIGTWLPAGFDHTIELEKTSIGIRSKKINGTLEVEIPNGTGEGDQRFLVRVGSNLSQLEHTHNFTTLTNISDWDTDDNEVWFNISVLPPPTPPTNETNTTNGTDDNGTDNNGTDNNGTDNNTDGTDGNQTDGEDNDKNPQQVLGLTLDQLMLATVVMILTTLGLVTILGRWPRRPPPQATPVHHRW
jgi:cobalamin biosynthesis protein CobT